MRARWYSPSLGRFLNEDPIGFSGGMNWYAYADGNPINLTDPFGLAAVGGTWSSIKSGAASSLGNFYNNFPGAVGRMFEESPAIRNTFLISNAPLAYGAASLVAASSSASAASSAVYNAAVRLTNLALRNPAATTTAVTETAVAVGGLAGHDGVPSPVGSGGQAAGRVQSAVSSLYDDIKRAGSRYANRGTDVLKTDFEKNLIDSGWARLISQDGKTIILQKDGAKYVLRDGAKSTGGPTADYYKAGSKRIDVKIRLEQAREP